VGARFFRTDPGKTLVINSLGHQLSTEPWTKENGTISEKAPKSWESRSVDGNIKGTALLPQVDLW